MLSFIRRKFWNNTQIRFVTAFAIVINVSHWVLIYLRTGTSSEQTTLHYNIYFGIDWFGQASRLYLYPFFGLCIIILNTFIAHQLYGHFRFVSQSLVLSAVFMNILLVLAGGAVLLFNSL
jgi:uncharacterized membrane protein